MPRLHPIGVATIALAVLLVGAIGGFLCWPEPTRADAPPAAAACTPAAPALDPGVTAPATRRFTLVAAPGAASPAPGQSFPVWTFNGTVPGPELRVRQGDRVEVVVCNRLPSPLAVHWHGYPVPNSADGVPGVTQDAIQPGASYTYAFEATEPGTYWYHSHQESTLQIDRGLYGALIVLPAQPRPEEQVDRDLTLVLADRFGFGAGPADLSELELTRHSLRQALGLSPTAPLTLNGRAYGAGEPIELRPGERVRLRFIHAGIDRQVLQLGGHRYRLIATDGQPVEGATETDALLPLYPAQRVDVVFTADNPGVWTLRLRNSVGPAVPLALIRYAGLSGAPGEADAAWGRDAQPLAFATYGTTAPDAAALRPGDPGSDLRPFAARGAFDQQVTLELNKPGDRYTLLDPAAPPSAAEHAGHAEHLEAGVTARPGELIQLTFLNHTGTGDLHPMHLHGHTFQILSVNGQPYTGAPIWRDTVNVGPKEAVVIAFRAGSPGAWMIHCHVLRHHVQGLGTVLLIGDAPAGYEPGGRTGNIPE